MAKTATVYGANAAGLSAALRLKNLGYEVTVVDADPAQSRNRFERDGFVFDMKDTFFTLPAVYRDLFLKTGGPLEESVDLLPLDDACRVEFEDGTHFTIPGASPARMSLAISEALGSSTGTEWAKFLQTAADIWDEQRQNWDLGDHVLDLSFKDSRLRSLVEAFALLQGRDPRRTPQAFSSHIYMLSQFGSWHIKGGLNQLTRALHDRAIERGVTITSTQSETVGDVVVNAQSVEAPQVSELHAFVAIEGKSHSLNHHNIWIDEDVVIYLCRPEDDSMHPQDREAWNLRVIARRSQSLSSNSALIPQALQRITSEFVGDSAAILWVEEVAPTESDDRPVPHQTHIVGGNYRLGLGLPFDGQSAELLAAKLRSQN